MPTKRRTSFTDLPQNASKELVSLQDSLIKDLSDLRQETIGLTTDTKVGPYAARYNESIRSLPPTAGTTMTFPPADSTTQNRWIEIMKLGGGALTIRPTSLLIDGAASVTLTTAGLYSYRSDGGTSWWRAASASGGLSPPVALTDLQQVTGPTLLGRVSALGSILALTAAQFTSIINLFTAALSGTVPASGGGTTNFLRADGSWAAPPAGGGTPTGTGFRHVTAGVEDAASKLVDTADINNDQVTYAKLQNVGIQSLVGNPTGAAADAQDIAVAADSIVARFGGTLGSQAAAAQSAFIKASGNLFNVTAAADQSLQRILTGDLGMSQRPKLLRVDLVTASVTPFVVATGTQYVYVELWGGCGAGGGAQAPGVNGATAGTGGNAGGKVCFLGAQTANFNIVIGAGGTGVAGAAGNPGTATTCTINGVALSASGGLGGLLLATGTTTGIAAPPAAVSGSGVGAQLINGQRGGAAKRMTSAAAGALIIGNGGKGADSELGAGGPETLCGTASAGQAATGLAAGGSGACSPSSGAVQTGGNGLGGAVRVWQFA